MNLGGNLLHCHLHRESGIKLLREREEEKSDREKWRKRHTQKLRYIEEICRIYLMEKEGKGYILSYPPSDEIMRRGRIESKLDTNSTRQFSW